jgi:hypothetical protein
VFLSAVYSNDVHLVFPLVISGGSEEGIEFLIKFSFGFRPKVKCDGTMKKKSVFGISSVF